jgi:hypothetical protein
LGFFFSFKVIQYPVWKKLEAGLKMGKLVLKLEARGWKLEEERRWKYLLSFRG